MDDAAHVPPQAAEQESTGEPRPPFPLYALKDHDTFLVADSFGDIGGVPGTK